MTIAVCAVVMIIFLIKLIAAPLLLALATLAARRWGTVLGGILIGLPLISGPISVFLAIETCKSSKDHSKPRNEVDTSLKSPV